jgi:hypothetical protein
MKNKKIVFLLGSISQSRCIKRIDSFISAGFKAQVVIEALKERKSLGRISQAF